jgi:hypothetical protein
MKGKSNCLWISSLFCKNRTWWLSALYISLLFPGVVLIVGFLLNFIAWGYGSLTAIPFATMIVVCVDTTRTHILWFHNLLFCIEYQQRGDVGFPFICLMVGGEIIVVHLCFRCWVCGVEWRYLSHFWDLY